MNATRSTRRRARRDGVATSLLYYYFDDRTALLTAAFRHANSQLIHVHDDSTGTGASG